MPRALISVSDKTDVVTFARALAARGYELVSTGGTARTLADAGLAVVPISEVTGVPEMMDGRVKTLHPRIHGGILARRTHAADLASAREQGIDLIDVVAVNLYPFAAAAARPETLFDALIEEIDIGGPSLVRAAAKNFPHVLVVVSPDDYEPLIAQLDQAEGVSMPFRFALARKAFAHTAAYDAAIAATLGRVTADGRTFTRLAPEAFPDVWSWQLQKRGDLRYGENPHQAAAWYAAGGGLSDVDRPASGLGGARLLQGKELSYTNLLDLDAAARIVDEFTEPAAAVIKHTNPCGVATGSSPADAYVRARDADPLSAFGGIVGLNRAIDADSARAITSTRIDAVIAPAVSDEAMAILAARPQMRVVVATVTADTATHEFRSVLGAVLVQVRDRVAEAATEWPADGMRVVTRRQPSVAEWQALRFAWRVCAHVKSNTVIFTASDRTLAIGAGQMSRVDAVNVATMKATASGVRLQQSVVASDAFFPFRDGLDAVAGAGATAVVQPGGSLRDPEVIAAADDHGLAMVFTGIRHFRH